MSRRPVRSDRSLLAGIAVAVAAGGAVAPRGANAQSPDSLTVDVGQCVDLASPEQRLACYERQVEEARKGAAPPAAVAESAPPAAAPASNAPSGDSRPAVVPREPRAAAPDAVADGSGRRGGRSDAEEAGAPAAEEAGRSTEVVGTITALRETVPNSYVITLDNGQVWRQRNPESYPLRVGQKVRIYAAKRRWGDALRLTAEHLNGFIRVERVR